MVAPTSVNGGRSSVERARRGPLADDDVDAEVLHRRVEDLLDGAVEAVDLVDEQHVARLERREDRGEVALALERRARRRAEADAELVRARSCASVVLPRPGGPDEQDVVERLAARLRAASSAIARCSLTRSWPTNSASVLRPQRAVELVVVALCRRRQEAGRFHLGRLSQRQPHALLGGEVGVDRPGPA